MGILDIRDEMENKELHRNPYPQFLKHFTNGVANNWTVAEISLQDDQEQWNVPGKLTDEEKQLVLKNLKFFGVCEALTMDNVAVAILPRIQDGYVRMALIRQAYEEALHSQTFLTIAESLSIKISDIYQEYKDTPSVKAKIDFVNYLIGQTEKDGFDITTIEGKQDLLQDMIGFFQILEGTFFFTNFAQLFSLRRKNKMKGLSSFIDYIARDESVHIAIGRDLINIIIKEYPEIWTPSFREKMSTSFATAVRLEDAYLNDTIPETLLGLNRESFKDYIRFIANRRMKGIGLEGLWPNMKNPFPWMSTENDLPTETNFFESRPKEYKTGDVNMDF